MLKISSPKLFEPEKSYIITQIFSDFLGLEVSIFFENRNTYNVVLPNGNSIELADAFFCQFTENENYLHPKNIPNQPIFTICGNLTSEYNLPIFWGTVEFEQQSDFVQFGGDIFASAFLMLSRWEENVSPERDTHGRFPDTQNILQRFDLQHRPIVNEYVEFLWNALKFLGYSEERKVQTFKLSFSHDVDYFLSYPNFVRFLKRLGGSLLKRHDFQEFRKSIHEYFGIKFQHKKDPYDTFDVLMDFSEMHGTVSQFNFIPAEIGEADADYNIDNKEVISKIRHILQRGHRVGLHGSYNSFNNSEIFERDLKRLRQIVPEISSGRQHFLRFEVPKTWQLWEANGLKSDSSLGFSNDVGFRCGVCYPFRVFDISERKTLNLTEEPLIFMDTALVHRGCNANEANAEFKKLFLVVQKYRGTFVVLVHNNSAILKILNSLNFSA